MGGAASLLHAKSGELDPPLFLHIRSSSQAPPPCHVYEHEREGGRNCEN